MASEQSAVAPPYCGSHHAQPEDVLQGWLVGVWKTLLRRPDFGIDDDFFALGGTRELSERMFAAIATLCDERLSAPERAGALTIRGVAAQIVARLEAQTRTRTQVSSPSAPRRQPPAVAQNVLHDQLLNVWEELLGTTVAGIDDDFFTLGGTRELCERMLHGVDDLCSVRIAAADLDRVLTVRSLAERLVARLPEAPVYEVQAGAPDVPPLVFLHGDLGGGGYYARELARGLGLEQPFFLLRQHGMHGDDVPPSIEEMAADHARHVSAIRPDGPLHLGGHCISAIIMLEVARQITQAGRDVASLLMIDPPVRLPQGKPVLPQPCLSPAARRLPRIREAWLFAQYREIVRMYRLPVYHGRTVVFWTHDTPDGTQALDRPDVRVAMERLAPHAEMHTCPGTHITALGRHVRSLAAVVKTALAGRQSLTTV